MSTPQEIMERDGKWVVAHTKAALPILIASAKKGQQLTYTDLNELVAKALGEKPNGNVGSYHMVLRHLGRVLDSLSDTWAQGEIPPLSVLGIRAHDRQPGTILDPHLVRYAEKFNHGVLTKQTRASLVKLATQHVHQYPHWDAVARELGIAL